MYESKDVMVSHPSHYKSKNGMEVIDVIEAFTSDLIDHVRSLNENKEKENK